jgi:Holliday junction resolvase
MAPEAGKGRGRPAVGKRSNPEWKLYSHFLKRQTQRAAAARLQAEDDGRDLSDVLQDLLERWVKSKT